MSAHATGWEPHPGAVALTCGGVWEEITPAHLSSTAKGTWKRSCTSKPICHAVNSRASWATWQTAQRPHSPGPRSSPASTCPRPRHALALPCAGLWGELGMETISWSNAWHTLPPFPMESALSQSCAQHLCGNHRPPCVAGHRVHPWEVQCPHRLGLLLLPVMDSL